MDESIIRASVLFFLVTLEDESLVYPSSEAALNSARKRKYQNESESLFALVISECTKLYLSRRYRSLGGGRPLSLENPPSPDLLSEIQKLRAKISDRLFVSFAWSEIVKAPRQEIANGLGITAGTVDHRAHEVLKRWAEVQ